MDKQARKIPDGQSNTSSSSDYALGLRILARIIARRHTRRIMANPESKDGVSKEK
jgi:hypothetical protein